MKEKPILMSTDMARAILDGKKTMTRRVIKIPDGYTITPTGNPKAYAVVKMGDGIYSRIPVNRRDNIKCPYGQVGSRLWVRETWWVHPDYKNVSAGWLAPTANSPERVFYSLKDSADWCYESEKKPEDWEYRLAKKVPSIHMPRWASRITLEITEIRVERLNQITDDDALAEGVFGDETCYDQATPCMCFEALWDSINAKRGCGWGTNPWVWAISFKEIKV